MSFNKNQSIEIKQLIYSISTFLESSISDDVIQNHNKESIKAAISTINQAFEVVDSNRDELRTNSSLDQIFEIYSKPKEISIEQSSSEDETDNEQKEEVFNYIKKSNKEMENKNLEKAIKTLSKGIKSHPNNTQLLVKRSFAYFELKEFENSCKDAKKASKLDKKLNNIYSKTRHALFCHKQYKEAIQECENLYKELDETTEKDSENQDGNRVTNSTTEGLGGLGGLSSLLNNPNLMNLASQFLGNTQQQSSSSNNTERSQTQNSPNPLAALLENPQIAEIARQFMNNSNNQ